MDNHYSKMQMEEVSLEDKKEHKPKKRKKRTIILSWIAIIFLLTFLFYFIYWVIWGRFFVSTDDAYVNGNVISLMPQIPGTVIAISADDTQLVEKGQEIIKLDPSDYLLALQKAKSNLASTVRQVRQYFEQAKMTLSDVLLRRADFVRAKLDLKRRVGLVGQKALSKEELQHFQTGAKAAEAQYEAALHRFSAAYALVENTHVYSHPFVEQAKLELKKTFLNLQRTTIVAPVTGYVAKRNVNVGQQVNMAVPMLAIIPISQIWVDANYKESQLQGLRIGQPVDVFADALPNVLFHGKIYGLNMGTGAAFAILPPQNATGNWIKIVQRLAVRIALDPKEIHRNPLQLGLSMHVSTDIHNQSGLRLANKSNEKTLYATEVFSNQLNDVENIIQTILKENSPDLYLPRFSSKKGQT